MLRFAIIFFLLFSSESSAQNYDVRKTYWGASPLDVQHSEKVAPNFDGIGGNYRIIRYSLYQYRDGQKYWFADWDYYFQRNKLVKATFSQRWKKNELWKYDRDKKYYTGENGKPTRSENNEKWTVNEWISGNRTFLKIYLNKNPNEYGFYYFNTQFVESKHKKELNKKKAKPE